MTTIGKRNGIDMTTPKLSSLTPDDKTRLLAELDGFYNLCLKLYTSNRTRPFEQENGWFGNRKPFDERQSFLVPDYFNSYDAILPLVQKLFGDDPAQWMHFANALSGRDSVDREFSTARVIAFVIKRTPSQLCDAVLVASGKAIL